MRMCSGEQRSAAGAAAAASTQQDVTESGIIFDNRNNVKTSERHVRWCVLVSVPRVCAMRGPGAYTTADNKQKGIQCAFGR